MSVLLKPITTEKAIRAIELENKIMFIVDRRATKAEIIKDIKDKFKVKVSKVNVHLRKNEKIAIIKLKADTPAIDIATKLGMI
jgi:large subunit ribosomal protein L23